MSVYNNDGVDHHHELSQRRIIHSSAVSDRTFAVTLMRRFVSHHRPWSLVCSQLGAESFFFIFFFFFFFWRGEGDVFVLGDGAIKG